MLTCAAARAGAGHGWRPRVCPDTRRPAPGPRPPSPGGTPAWSRERNNRRNSPAVINKVKLTQSPGRHMRDTRDPDTIRIQDQRINDQRHGPKSVTDLVHGGVLVGGAGGLHAVPGQVVVRRERRVQREARAHAAQPGLVVSANISIVNIPDQTRRRRRRLIV